MKQTWVPLNFDYGTMYFVTTRAKSAAVACLRVVLTVLSGWLAWMWFANLFAMGEAGLAGPVPLLTKLFIWAILATAALVTFALGLLSYSVPWRLCVLATAYPFWRLTEGGVAGSLTVTAFVFAIFLLTATLGSKLRTKLQR